MIFQVNPLLGRDRQRIHMKIPALFSTKNKIKMSSAAIFVWRSKV